MNQSFFEESRMKIRYAEVFDAASLVKINCEAWQIAYANLIPDEILQKRHFSQDRVLRMENRIKERKNIILVAEDDKRIVTGYVWGGVGRDERIKQKKELYALYVAPLAQGKGYGSALLNAFAEAVADDFYLFALKGNKKAKKFYLKHGGRLKPEFEKQQVDTGFLLQEECFFFSKA